MNIFFLHSDPKRAAQSHCDSHVVKMNVETLQLISTAIWVTDTSLAENLHLQGKIYRPTHENHPCALWLRRSRANAKWAVALGLALGDEFTYRFGTTHKSHSVLRALKSDKGFMKWLTSLPDRLMTVPALSVDPTCFRNLAEPLDSVVASYRQYYIVKKISLLTYTKREPPEWLMTSPVSHFVHYKKGQTNE